MQHLCHAIGCSFRVPPKYLMCGPHWFMVPELLRREVWRTYKPGQEETMSPSQEWIEAARAAINHVAALEGLPPLPEHGEVIRTLETELAKKQADEVIEKVKEESKGEQDAPGN